MSNSPGLCVDAMLSEMCLNVDVLFVVVILGVWFIFSALANFAEVLL